MAFTPALEPATARLWRETATWMAPHAKFFALYERAFWREAGLSGTAQSMVGPMAEMHDATTASGRAALFGFLGIDAEQRAAVGEERLTRACLAQLARIFGSEAFAAARDAAEGLGRRSSDGHGRGQSRRRPCAPQRRALDFRTLARAPRARGQRDQPLRAGLPRRRGRRVGASRSADAQNSAMMIARARAGCDEACLGPSISWAAPHTGAAPSRIALAG